MAQVEQMTFLNKEFNDLSASVIDREDMFADPPFQVDMVLSGNVILAK
ncbi:MAG: hypothetical protein AVDCRST_MAG86-841, partial [uncultured Truepera sp.]